MSVAAIVPAAGAGRRFGGRVEKPFAPLDRQPLVLHALRALQLSPAIRWIILVVHAGQLARARRILKAHRITKALPPCAGGPSREASVARGFAALPAAARWVLVHDGVRPCLSPQLIANAVRAGKRHGAVACGLPAGLTVKAVDPQGRVRLTLDREQLWLVQTPQVFRRDWFAEALGRTLDGRERFPDDAARIEAAGFPVRMLPGDAHNLKVTTQQDLVLAEAILRLRRNGRSSVQRRAYSG